MPKQEFQYTLSKCLEPDPDDADAEPELAFQYDNTGTLIELTEIKELTEYKETPPNQGSSKCVVPSCFCCESLEYVVV